MLYYIFILDVNFLLAGKTPGVLNEHISLSFNFSDKIMLISSIFFFHLSPTLIQKKLYKPYIKFLINRSVVLIPLIGCLIYFFNYQTEYTGGGIFFHLSDTIFNNNYLFFITSIFSIGFFVYIASLNLSNFALLFLLVISNIQNTIYHKYYEPLTIILYFTLLSQVEAENFLKEKKYIYYLYLLSFIFIFMRILKNFNVG